MSAQHKRAGGNARTERREGALERMEAGWPRIVAKAGGTGEPAAVYLNRRVKEMNALRRNLGMEPRTDLRAAA